MIIKLLREGMDTVPKFLLRSTISDNTLKVDIHNTKYNGNFLGKKASIPIRTGN